MATPIPNPQEVPDLEEKLLLSWRSPERAQHKRSKEFYSTVVILALLVSIILFFIEGLMPVLVIWAIVFVIYAIDKTPPQEIDHKLSTWGVRTGTTLYRYGQINQAWFDDRSGSRVLRMTLNVFPWQMNLIVPREQERDIKQVLSDMRVALLKPDATRVDRLVKWFNEKIPLEETK